MNRIKFITYFLNRLSLSSARLVKYWRSASIQNQNEQEHEQIPLLIQDHLRPAIVLLCTSGFTEVNFHVISWQLAKLFCRCQIEDGCCLWLCLPLQSCCSWSVRKKIARNLSLHCKTLEFAVFRKIGTMRLLKFIMILVILAINWGQQKRWFSCCKEQSSFVLWSIWPIKCSLQASKKRLRTHVHRNTYKLKFNRRCKSEVGDWGETWMNDFVCRLWPLAIFFGGVKYFCRDFHWDRGNQRQVQLEFPWNVHSW